MKTVTCAAIMIAAAAIGCDGNDARVHDADGNAYSLRDMPDGHTWIGDNLNLALPDSYCHGNMASECERFGRLYTWESAAKACSLLGSGWRLPTDDEWRQMSKRYGGVRGDSESDGQAAYEALLKGGVSGFNVVLGGNREPDGAYARIEEHGFYWTATESDKGHAWFYNFGRGGGFLNRHSGGDKSMAVSVRCVKVSE